MRRAAVDGTSGLPLTLDQSTVFAWVDRTITPNSEAVMVPYPMIRNDYAANLGFWWDLEFWNRSVDREVARPNQFSSTSAGSFPKIDLRFDPDTGRASFDADSYVAQAVGDARYHVQGRLLTTERDVSLVFPDRPWHADWLSFGLYPDGWTRPGRTARIRVFGNPAQKDTVERILTLSLLAPTVRRVRIDSDAGHWSSLLGAGTVQERVYLCVPRTGYADLSIRADGSTNVGGAPTSAAASLRPRQAGVLVGQVALADELFVRCPTSP